MARDANKRFLEREDGGKVVMFMFEFTGQPVNITLLDVKAGRKSLREIKEAIERRQ